MDAVKPVLGTFLESGVSPQEIAISCVEKAFSRREIPVSFRETVVSFRETVVSFREMPRGGKAAAVSRKAR
jgi:hypothetical protein